MVLYQKCVMSMGCQGKRSKFLIAITLCKASDQMNSTGNVMHVFVMCWILLEDLFVGGNPIIKFGMKSDKIGHSK